MSGLGVIVLGRKGLAMDDVLVGAVLDRLGQHQLKLQAEDLLPAACRGDPELAPAIGERRGQDGLFRRSLVRIGTAPLKAAFAELAQIAASLEPKP